MGVKKKKERKRCEELPPDDRTFFPPPELSPGQQASLLCVSELNGYTQTALYNYISTMAMVFHIRLRRQFQNLSLHHTNTKVQYNNYLLLSDVWNLSQAHTFKQTHLGFSPSRQYSPPRARVQLCQKTLPSVLGFKHSGPFRVYGHLRQTSPYIIGQFGLGRQLIAFILAQVHLHFYGRTCDLRRNTRPSYISGEYAQRLYDQNDTLTLWHLVVKFLVEPIFSRC